jgi:hypothetical protein
MKAAKDKLFAALWNLQQHTNDKESDTSRMKIKKPLIRFEL